MSLAAMRFNFDDIARFEEQVVGMFNLGDEGLP